MPELGGEEADRYASAPALLLGLSEVDAVMFFLGLLLGFWLACLAFLLVVGAASRERKDEEAEAFAENMAIHEAMLTWLGSALQTQGKVKAVLVHRPKAFIQSHKEN